MDVFDEIAAIAAGDEEIRLDDAVEAYEQKKL